MGAHPQAVLGGGLGLTSEGILSHKGWLNMGMGYPGRC